MEREFWLFFYGVVELAQKALQKYLRESLPAPHNEPGSSKYAYEQILYQGRRVLIGY